MSYTKDLKMYDASTYKGIPDTGSAEVLCASGLDDAASAGLFELYFIADGSLPMPFCHVSLFVPLLTDLKQTKYNNPDSDIYKTLEIFIKQFIILNKLSMVRNQRLMGKIMSKLKETDFEKFKTFKPFIGLSDDDCK